jgi:hydroxymethylpyrimidine/phosphomethylpyrimidine kinase
MASPPPVALTIAGSDCCSGAGLQADLKTFGAHGVHGLTVVTAVVSETPFKVADVHEVPPAVVQSQLSLLLESYPVAAVKTGMLYSKAHVVAVADLLEGRQLPLVVDPVMIATSGASLLTPDAIAALEERLLPLATLITPNLPELMALTREPEGASHDDLIEQLGRRFGCSVLLTGGHHPEGGLVRDTLWHAETLRHFESPWIEISSSHGTGCTISAAIAANLAHGKSIPEAVGAAKEFVTGTLQRAHEWPERSGELLVALDQVTPADGEG